MTLTKDEYKEMRMLMEMRDITEVYNYKDLIRLNHLEIKANDSQLGKAIAYVTQALATCHKKENET